MNLELPKDTLIKVEKVEELRGEVRDVEAVVTTVDYQWQYKVLRGIQYLNGDRHGGLGTTKRPKASSLGAMGILVPRAVRLP